MNRNDARRLAEQTMGEYGLIHDGWTFQFDRAKNRFGQCRYRTRTISLSGPLTDLNDEAEVNDTILHEIAHALVGRGKGHGPEWRAMAVEVGARPERCFSADDVEMPDHRWHGMCDVHGVVAKRHRLAASARRFACGHCCRGTYDKQYQLTWVDTRTGATWAQAVAA